MSINVCLCVYNECICIAINTVVNHTPYHTRMSFIYSEYYTRKGWPFAEKEYLEGLFK